MSNVECSSAGLERAQPVTDVGYPFDRTGVSRDRRGILRFDSVRSTYVAALEESVSRSADSLAVADDRDGVTMTYGQLWDRVRAVAGGLRRAGVAPGDRVCIDLPNSANLVVGFLAAMTAGAVAVPIDQRRSPAGRDDIVKSAAPAVVIGPDDELPTGRPLVYECEPCDIGEILYTSGTTGEPKGVMATQQNLAGTGEITARSLRLAASDRSGLRNLVVIPLCHSAGCNGQMLPTLLLGGSVAIARSTASSEIVGCALRHEPNTVLAVPAMLALLVERERDRLGTLSFFENVIYGAAPMPTSVIAQLKELLPNVRLGNAFGMTEINNIALFLPDEWTMSHSDSVGLPVPVVDARLDNVDDRGWGELLLRGPNMALGYWQDPAATEKVFGSGWVRTGDIAEIDGNGFVYLRDRAKDVINRGGEKISSLEIEDVLYSHPGIVEAAAVGVADSVMGEKVGVVVVEATGWSIEEKDVRDAVGAALPRQCVPEYVVVVKERLPRGASGKVLKSELRRTLDWTSFFAPRDAGHGPSPI